MEECMGTRNEKKVLLTVVTATFNSLKAGRGDLLDRCVRSVAKIGIPHEHLIFDGASSDGTIERLKQLASQYGNIKAASETDRGIYDAYNKGWRAAAGEWVYFLGDDDCITDARVLESVVRDAMESDAEMVLSPVDRPGRRQQFRSWKDMRCLLTMTPYSHQGVLMRQSLIERLGGFDERFRIVADLNLFLTAHLANATVRYDWRKYAEFNVGGVSSIAEPTFREMSAVVALRLGLSEEQREEVLRRRILPLAKTFPLVWHPSREIRFAARHAIKRWIAAHLGLLDEGGNPKSLRLFRTVCL